MTRFFAAFLAIVTATGCAVETDVSDASSYADPSPSEMLTELPASDASEDLDAFDPCAAQEPGEYALVVPGFEDRTALVYVPAVEGPRDAVVMLHGGGGDGVIARNVTRYASAAASRGMVSVFPDGVDNVWRAGFTDWITMQDEVDDVAYLSALSDALSDQVCVDRVLAAGFSNGSMMVQRWACEGTGVDAVVGSGGTRVEHTCDQPPVPVLYSHGTADTRITYDGSPSPETGRAWPSVAETMDAWLEHNGWNGEDPELTVAGPVSCSAYEGLAPVMHCKVLGWGHSWPGGRNVPASSDLGLTNVALDWFDSLANDGLASHE